METQNPNTCIMLVERDELSLQLLELLFKKAGNCGELLKFTSYAEAATYLNTERVPDLIITDFFLSKLDDFRFLLLVKQLENSLQESIRLIVSGDFESDQHKIPEEIEADFVLKPVEISIIKKWLEIK